MLFVMSCQDRQEVPRKKLNDQECREKLIGFVSQCINCELDAEDLFQAKKITFERMKVVQDSCNKAAADSVFFYDECKCFRDTL